MAFTINIYYTGSNGSAKQFAVNDDETILLIDSWENQKALDEHHKSETMKKILELRNKYDLHMKVERYSLEDNKEKDKKYIKD